jgi:hypothetical protein
MGFAADQTVYVGRSGDYNLCRRCEVCDSCVKAMFIMYSIGVHIPGRGLALDQMSLELCMVLSPVLQYRLPSRGINANNAHVTYYWLSYI